MECDRAASCSTGADQQHGFREPEAWLSSASPDNPTNDYGKLKDQIGVEIPDGSSTGSRSKTDALNSLEAQR